MANGTKKQPWYPADDEQAEKAAQGEVYQGQDGEYYQHENMPKASPKNPPAPAAPAPPNAPEVASLADVKTGAELSELAQEVERGQKTIKVTFPETTPVPAASFAKPAPVAPHNVDYDSDKFDSTTKNLKDGSLIAPRGENRPPDVMSEEEKAAIADKQEAKRRVGMAVTHSVDSVGKPKGEFKTTPQGNDKNGARIPDKVDYSTVVEAHNPVVGPRGAGAPKDTFHKV